MRNHSKFPMIIGCLGFVIGGTQLAAAIIDNQEGEKFGDNYSSIASAVGGTAWLVMSTLLMGYGIPAIQRHFPNLYGSDVVIFPRNAHSFSTKEDSSTFIINATSPLLGAGYNAAV